MYQTSNAVWRFDSNSKKWSWISGSDNFPILQISMRVVYEWPDEREGQIYLRYNAQLSNWNTFLYLEMTAPYPYLNPNYEKELDYVIVSRTDKERICSNFRQSIHRVFNPDMKLSSVCNGIFGEKGMSSPENVPQGRSFSASWLDWEDNLWIFSGKGYFVHGELPNDVWRFNTSSLEWTWITGSLLPGSSSEAVYNLKGDPSSTSTPGARFGSASWTVDRKSFWLFGGELNQKGILMNDVWKFNSSSKQWTWVCGSRVGVNRTGVFLIQPSEYCGDQPDIPGARVHAVTWMGNDGNFWLFGGDRFDCLLSDIWSFNLSSHTWKQQSRNNGCNSDAQYGVRGTFHHLNLPGSRSSAIVWNLGNRLLLYGGECSSSRRLCEDLWLFDQIKHEWSWIGGHQGSSTSHGDVGNPELMIFQNSPGARSMASSWLDDRKIYLYGGSYDIGKSYNSFLYLESDVNVYSALSRCDAGTFSKTDSFTIGETNIFFSSTADCELISFNFNCRACIMYVNHEVSPVHSYSTPLSIGFGNTTFELTVHSFYYEVKVYNLVVNRVGSLSVLENIQLSNGELQPLFSPQIYSYLVNIESSLSEVRILPLCFPGSLCSVTVGNSSEYLYGINYTLALGPEDSTKIVLITVFAAVRTYASTQYQIKFRRMSSNPSLQNIEIFSDEEKAIKIIPSFPSNIHSSFSSFTSAIVSRIQFFATCQASICSVFVQSSRPNSQRIKLVPKMISSLFDLNHVGSVTDFLFTTYSENQGIGEETQFTISVRRQNDNAELDNLLVMTLPAMTMVSYGFHPSGSMYSFSVPANVHRVRISCSCAALGCSTNANNLTTTNCVGSTEHDMHEIGSTTEILVHSHSEDMTMLKSYILRIRRMNNNPLLSSLNIVLPAKNRNLDYHFSSTQFQYQVSVIAIVSNVNLLIVCQKIGCRANINGIPMQPNILSQTLHLGNIGTVYSYVINVQAEDGSTSTSYTLNIRRMNNNPLLSMVSVRTEPSQVNLPFNFAPEKNVFDIYVLGSVQEISFNGICSSSGCMISVNNVSQQDNHFGLSWKLLPMGSDNFFYILSKSEDGTTWSHFYRFRIRRQSNSPTLKTLRIFEENGKELVLSPPFTPNEGSYSGFALNEVAVIKIIPECESEICRIVFDNIAIISGQHALTNLLPAGTTTPLSMRVESEDMTASKQYYFPIVRGQPTENNRDSRSGFDLGCLHAHDMTIGENFESVHLSDLSVGSKVLCSVHNGNKRVFSLKFCEITWIMHHRMMKRMIQFFFLIDERSTCYIFECSFFPYFFSFLDFFQFMCNFELMVNFATLTSKYVYAVFPGFNISVTFDHLVWVHGKGEIPAKNVGVGDQMLFCDPAKFVEDQIEINLVSVEFIRIRPEETAILVLTESGFMVVNGVIVSCLESSGSYFLFHTINYVRRLFGELGARILRNISFVIGSWWTSNDAFSMNR